MNLVVFDIDGTLIQYHRKRNDAAYVRAVKEVLGVEIEDSWGGFVTSTDSGILDEISVKFQGRPCQRDEINSVKLKMEALLVAEYGQEPFTATPQALDTWNRLMDDLNVRVAVATGNWGFSGRFKLASAGFDLGAVPLASADDGIHRVDLLRHAYEKASQGVNFERVVYVGDWIWDVRAAKALGWDFIGIGGEEIEKALRAEGAEQVFRDFGGLYQSLMMGHKG
jgi:phosphoglycolate phosphatase-like HAD superfamily hydrolase